MTGSNSAHTWRPAAACLLALAVSAVARTEVPVQDGWLRLTTPHFDVVGPAPEIDLRLVGERLERFRQALARMLPDATLAAARPTRVVVFPTHATYEPFKPLYDGRAKSLVEGHAVSAAGRTYMLLTTAVGSDLGVIYHEYVHVLLHATRSWTPTWFDEGLAELYSTFEVTPSGRAVIGTAPRGHVERLRQGRWLPLEELAAVDHVSPLYNEEDKASTFYPESWAFVHYLLLGSGGRDAGRVVGFLQRLAEGERLETAVASLDTTVQQLERDVAAYVERDTLPRRSLTLGAPPASIDGAGVRSVAPAEAHTTLGDVLFLMGRTEEAEAQLRAALTADGSYAPAHAVLGQLLSEHGRSAEARAHLERAIASPSATWLTHLAYATVLIEDRPRGIENAPDDTVIERSLRRAMALNPAAAEPFGQLAWLKAQSRATIDEAVSLAAEALARAPGDETLALLRAQVLVNARQYAEARALLTRLGRANDADVRRQADDILGKLDALALATAGRTASDVGLRVTGQADQSEGILVFRPLAPGERRVAGWLSSVSCGPRGVVFAGRTTAGPFRFHAARLDDVRLLTYSEVRRGLRCGERPRDLVAVVTYRAAPRASGLAGRAVAIEFPPAGYEPE